MQRRAAALYAAFFIILAAGSYAMIGVAEEPAISVDDPAHTLVTGDEITVDGRTYSVRVSGGEAELTWTDEDALQTESWDDGSTVTVDGTDFSVTTDADATPPTVELIEERSLGENVSTIDREGQTYVIIEEDGQQVLVPRDEYLTEQFGPPTRIDYEQGDEFAYNNQTVTLATVTNTSATIEWREPVDTTVTAAEGDNVTLNEQPFVAHFPDDRTLELSTDYAAYQNEVAAQDTFQERVNGLWGVSILSALAAITLLALSYVPSRY